MSRRRWIGAASLALLGTCILVLAPAAEAVSEPTSGWWSRLATATPTDEVPAALPVPAPSSPETIPAGATVPPGQLLVEGTPDGATAIAAVRWQLDDGESSPSLTLPIAPGSSLNPESILLACKSATPWTTPESAAGSWDVKPLVDGSRCVNGIIAEDLSTVSFGLQPLVSGSDLDVVLVPGEAAPVEIPAGVPEPPADIDGSTFRFLFDPPSAEALELIAGDFSEGAGDTVVTLPPADLPSQPAPSATGDFGGADLAASSPEFTPPEEAAAPALEPQDLAPSVPDVREAVPASRSSPVNRTIGFVLLGLAAAMAAWAHWTSTTAAPGDAGDPPVGGLSRFARPRTTPPTPLT